MRYHNAIIKAVLADHWQKTSPAAIAQRVNIEVVTRKRKPITEADVHYIKANFTLRHHGEPVLRKNWPPDENDKHSPQLTGP
jgi:hypothetical protein